MMSHVFYDAPGKVSSELGVPVFALNLRNHNLTPSNKHCGPMRSWTDLVKDLEAFVEAQLDGGKFSLLGHSLGGQVCLATLLTKDSKLASRVDKACIVDISLRHPSSKLENDHLHTLMKQMLKINSMALRSRSDVIKCLRECESDEHVINFLLTNLTSESDGTLKFSRLGLADIHDSWSKLKLDWDNSKQRFFPWHGKIHFIRGENSSYISDLHNDKEEIDKYFPTARFHTVPKSGHWPHFDNPKEFFDIIKTIFASE